MLYSLIVLSCNKLDVTRSCLTALVRESRLDGPADLIAVDNGSSDGSAEWLEGELPAIGAEAGMAVRVIRNAVNAGCSTARNQALERARGDYAVFVDNDVRPCTREWLTILRRRIEAMPLAGLAGAKLIYPWAPFPIQCAGVGISRRGHVCFRGRGDAREEPRWNRAEPVQCLISACLMVRRSLIERHGGFDEAYNPVQFEDFDLCYRLREAGWEAWYDPAAEMYHHESVTTQGTQNLMNAAVVVRNGLRFQRKWRHCFEQEDGPGEAACRWRRITLPDGE
jgi:O-antigen biosynthesis protein